MKRILTVFSIIIATTTLAISADDLTPENTVGKILVKKSFINNPYNCSSFLFKNSHEEVFMGTAHHCLPYGSESKRRKAFAHTAKIKKIKNRFIQYRIKDRVNSYNRDLSILKPLKYQNLSILELAKSEPQHGDKVYVLGYAARGGHQKLKLECRYLGKGAYNLGERKSILGDYIQCDHNRASIGGMSGGPIINTDGEVLGVLSAEVLSADDENISLPILIYQELKDQQFLNGKIDLDNSGKYLFKDYVDGVYSAKRVDMKEKDTEVTVSNGLIID